MGDCGHDFDENLLRHLYMAANPCKVTCGQLRLVLLIHARKSREILCDAPTITVFSFQ